MAFNGKLLELKTNNSYVEFPLKYIKPESYDATPDQRMEISAGRATTGKLKRTTCEHMATKIELNTIPLTNKEVKEISDILIAAFTDTAQRNLEIRYYHPETDSYKTGEVYMPDIQYPINRIDLTTNTIYYNSIRYAFIEY